jgi:putative membrane protein
MMPWPDGGMSGEGWVLMAIGMVLFWGLIITGAVLLIRTMNRRTGGRTLADRPSPGQLLAERFARGEIDEDEYQRRVATLAAAASRVP